MLDRTYMSSVVIPKRNRNWPIRRIADYLFMVDGKRENMAMLRILLVVYGFFNLVNSAGVSYDYNSPDTWQNSYSICGYSRQSPIDIPPIVSMNYDSSLTAFQLSNFDMPNSKYNLTIKNTGGTVQVDVDGDVQVRGGGLPYQYRLAQFHFHWGADDTKGSEHTYNGYSYPLELHLVTYNSYKYSDFGAAVDKDDGLAVLGFFFEITDEVPNCNYAPLLEYLTQVAAKDSSQTVSGYKLRHLMPAKMENYFRYQGSLTTPPCYESVTWTVFRDKIPVTSEQMRKFRALYSDVNSTTPIVKNYRPPQPLNQRQVTTNIMTAETMDPNSASALCVNIVVTFVFVLTSLVFM